MAAIEKTVEANEALLDASNAKLARSEAKLARSTTSLRVFGVITVCATFAAALVILLTDSPWLPTERLVVAGRAPFTAFVLRADPEELVVLDASSRRLERLDAAALVSRRFCRPGGGSWLSGLSDSVAFRRLLTLYQAPPTYPRCSTLGS